ncbi:MAG: response regulator transcription factor [Pseudomonadota bacterium]
MSGLDHHILVVDDDRQIRELLQKFLARFGYAVTTAQNADDAEEKMRSIVYDVLVLDVMMPGRSGLEFAQDVRRTQDVPILMLTAKGATDDRIIGLEAGADDYLPKPFEPRELLLRIQSLIRRTERMAGNLSPDAAVMKLGDLQYHRDTRRLMQEEHDIHLTSQEKTILHLLAQTPFRAISRESLAKECGMIGDSRAIDVQIMRLRRKVERNTTNQRYIATVRNRGYMLQPDV